MPRRVQSTGSSIHLSERKICPNYPSHRSLYGEHEAQYNIATLDTIHGSLPRRAHALVVEWASLHKDELMKNWDRCQVPAPAIPIEPLE